MSTTVQDPLIPSKWTCRALTVDSPSGGHTHEGSFWVWRGLNSRTVIIIPPHQSPEGSTTGRALLQPSVFHAASAGIPLHASSSSTPYINPQRHLEKVNSVNSQLSEKWASLVLPVFHQLSLWADVTQTAGRCQFNGFVSSPESRASRNKPFCSLYTKYSRVHTAETTVNTHAHSHTHLVSSFQNRIFTVTEKEIHWQWSLFFLLTRSWKKNGKGHRVQEEKKIRRKQECWKIFITETKETHGNTHTLTALCVYIHTTNTMSKQNEFKPLASADQHFKSKIVRDCMSPILSEMISRNHFSDSQRSTKVPAAFLLSVVKHSVWPVWTRQRRMVTCSVCTACACVCNRILCKVSFLWCRSWSFKHVPLTSSNLLQRPMKQQGD